MSSREMRLPADPLRTGRVTRFVLPVVAVEGRSITPQP
jgi:hypothetical protein